jgi:type III restriction enzyme
MHPQLPYDGALVEEIAATLDLRAPNAAALDVLARKFDESGGEPFEVVCDLATAVGKTYIAAGLLEYVVAQGVRNFLIVVPSRPILRKTVNNFTRAHAKAVPGLSHDLLVVTGDNFERAEVGTALEDEDVVKLFVFTVQQLLKPGEKASRRVRDPNENIGAGLYEHLQAAGDLVVIADEHHSYFGKKFSAAIRDLDAMALVGLTATVDPKTPAEQIVYRYTLGQAIGDKLVKTPVLVGRKDDRRDVETQLADGVALLAAKRDAVATYCAQTGAASVNPVMFVVCQSIDDADEVAEILRRPDFFGDEYADAVLTIHSDAAEDALERLEKVEEPGSPVRVIVSVSMLKEGWDVKNIYVICALRALASQVLTEQTMGRGLRLPFGRLTGIEMLDTLEVLGHDRYEELLRRSGALLRGLVTNRLEDTGLDHVNPTTGLAEPPAPTLGAGVAPAPLAGEDVAAEGVEAGLRVADIEERKAQVAAEAADLATAVGIDQSQPTFYVPGLTRTITASEFSLSSIDEEDFRALGRSLAAEPEEMLKRTKLEVVIVNDRPEIRPAPATDRVLAAPYELNLGEGADTLVAAVLNLGLVKQSRREMNAARRLVDALLDGLGDGAERRLGAFMNTAVGLAGDLVRKRHRSTPVIEDLVVTEEPFRPTRFLRWRKLTANRHGKFDPKKAYEGWEKSLVHIEWFDSSTERDFANLIDETDAVTRWARLHTGELVVPWRDINYNPDFAVEDVEGAFWLVETKADRDMEHPDVLAKKAGAEDWARRVSDETGKRWRYLLVGESQLKAANGSWSLLVKLAQG